jgi:riboflavin synthase
VVQGHVDGVGTLLSLEALDPAHPETSDWRLRLRLPLALRRYVVAQGSITVEGISLTVADLREDVVSIAIIPHTYKATALYALAPGAELNIEVDVLSKYAEARSVAEAKPDWTVTEEYLLVNGY